LWHNKLSVCCYLCNKFHGAASLLSGLRFLRRKGISLYFVTRNYIFVFTKPTIGVYYICMPKDSNRHPIMFFLEIHFVFFFHMRLGCQAAFCVRLFPLMHSMHFLSVLYHVLSMIGKLTLSMIYVTLLPHFWTFLFKVREISYYKVASSTT